MPYDENSIVTLSQEDAEKRFQYVTVEQMANQYPTVSTEFLNRLVEACELANWSTAIAAKRYCEGDKTIKPPDGFEDIYRELIAKNRQ